MSRYFILDGQRPIETDCMSWARWFEKNQETRIVAKSSKEDGTNVSTVFVGIDMGYDDNGPPIVFETMIFGGEHDQWQDRCSTWEGAEEMHKVACQLAGVTS
jgi:hypothetical protein